jgi:hypothetical protein
MDEVYTCICGNQKWVIKVDFIECTKCEREYGHQPDGFLLDRNYHPGLFNEAREQYLQKGGKK